MNLSPHFTLGELTASQTAARKGLSNEPDAAVLANLNRLAHTLERIRDLVGLPIVVSSGYRSPAVNKAVGGAKNSAHMTGCAADITCHGVPNRMLAQQIVAAKLGFDQVILEFPDSSTGGWVHVAIPDAGKSARNEVLTINTGTGYVTGLA